MATRYWKEIVEAAAVEKLDPLLVESVVVQESGGNTDAFRFERQFYNRYLKAHKLYQGQNPRRISSSYGLMQLMLPVAHERGYDPTHPPEMLFIPEIGLRWGCRHLAYLKEWADTGWPQVPVEQRIRATLASYNGGRGSNKPTDTPLRNRSYAEAVLRLYDQLQRERDVILSPIPDRG